MKRKILLSLIISLMFALSFHSTINAEDDKGSITIEYVIEQDNNGNRTSIPVPGATFKIYKVYSAIENTITLESPFDNALSSSGNPLTGSEIKMMESEEIQKLSEAFEQCVDSSTAVVATKTTDSSGKFKVDNLDRGAYLFIQEKPIVVDKQYFMANSFLVTVPYEDAKHNILLNVDIKPKGTIIKNPSIVKYVNDVSLYGLVNRDEIFTYSICSYIPSVGVNTFTIYDVLEDVLEFAPNLNFKLTVGDDNNYEIFTAEQLGSKLKIDENTRTISLDLDNSFMSGFRGKAIRIDFDARIKSGANLSKYSQRRVPNHACYVVDNFIKANSYDQYIASRSFNRAFMILGPLKDPSPIFEMCSEDVYVYVPEKPIIPTTGVLIMEALENNPWIIIVVLLVVMLIAKTIYDNYNKTTR